MKKTALFKLSALSLALAGQYAYADLVNHTCSVSSDCYYSTLQSGTTTADGKTNTEYYWYLNSTKLGKHNDDLEASVTPQHYQNIPSPDDNIRGSNSLIGIGNSDKDFFSLAELEYKRKASLYIPSGTTATVANSGRHNANVVSIRNANAKIDSGVRLQAGESEDEKALLVTIDVSGKSNVTTSADIILKSRDATGIWANDSSTVTAKNHKIELSPESSGVLARDNAKVVLENVNITGSNALQFALEVGESGSSIEFNQGTIDLTNDILTVAASLGTGKIDINHSNVNANYAVFSDAYWYKENEDYTSAHSVVNINHSNVTGRELFVAVNTNEATEPLSRDYSTTVNVESSKISGRVVNMRDVSDENEDNELDIRIDTQANTNVDLTMKNSQWTVNGDSHLNGLAMANSTTSLQKTGDQFQTLTITDYLIGNGHFDLNTDLANQQSDKIVVKGEDSGRFTLGIKDSGNEPKAANGKVTLVETQTGQAQFSLKDREYVDAGAYRYRLNKEGTNWVLANRQAEPVKNNPTQPTLPAKPVTPASTEPTQPAVQPKPVVPTQPVVVQPTQPQPIQPSQPIVAPVLKALSEKSNALVSLRQAQGVLLSQNLQGVHQRLGELKTDKSSNVWVKNTNSRSEAKAQNVAVDSRSSGFEMDSHSLQVGADRAVNDNLRLGGFVGTSRADVDFNGEYSKGKLRSQAVGLYATFANEQGWYLDNIAKYELLTAKFVDEKRKYNAVSLSSEIGKRFALSNDWSITPQAQLAYHTINGKADESRLNLFTARAGVRVAKSFTLNNGWNVQPYAEVNAITEKANKAKVRVNQYQFDVAENKGRVQTALGLTAGNRNHRLGLEASITSGSKFKQPLSVLANYRYQW